MEASEQGTNHQHTAPEGRALLDEFGTAEIVEAQVVGLERIVVSTEFVDLYTYFLEEIYEVVGVEDIRDIVYYHLLVGEQRGAYHLQGLVFGALRRYGALQTVSALNDE